jgi:hypothetical protein
MNLFDNLPGQTEQEIVTELLSRERVREGEKSESGVPVVQLGDPQRYSLVKFRISRISALSPFKSGLTPCQEAGWSGRKLISIVSLALRDDFLQVSPMLFTSDLLSEQSESVLSCLMFTASTPPYVGFQQPFSIRATTY